MERYFVNYTNQQIIDLYKILMVSSYESYEGIFGSYHPKYEHNRVHMEDIPKVFKFNLYTSTILKILEEISFRMENGSFYEQAYWCSRGILQTKICFPIKETRKSTLYTPIRKKNVETIEYLNKVYTYLDSGSKRKVYLSPCKTYVIKVPSEPVRLGLEENKEEERIYKQNPNSYYAKCELLENDWLKMEYVETILLTVDDDLPSWVSTIAEGQVGRNLKGELVAYDYGSEI